MLLQVSAETGPFDCDNRARPSCSNLLGHLCSRLRFYVSKGISLIDRIKISKVLCLINRQKQVVRNKENVFSITNKTSSFREAFKKKSVTFVTLGGGVKNLDSISVIVTLFFSKILSKMA